MYSRLSNVFVTHESIKNVQWGTTSAYVDSKVHVLSYRDDASKCFIWQQSLYNIQYSKTVSLLCYSHALSCTPIWSVSYHLQHWSWPPTPCKQNSLPSSIVYIFYKNWELILPRMKQLSALIWLCRTYSHHFQLTGRYLRAHVQIHTYKLCVHVPIYMYTPGAFCDFFSTFSTCVIIRAVLSLIVSAKSVPLLRNERSITEEEDLGLS